MSHVDYATGYSFLHIDYQYENPYTMCEFDNQHGVNKFNKHCLKRATRRGRIHSK
jgi:hypothetical protein